MHMKAPASGTRKSLWRGLRGFFRWEGVLGRLRARRGLALAVAAGSILLTAAVGWFVVYPYWDGSKHWELAEKAEAEHDFVAAKTHLERCLQVWPSSGETHWAMARVCRRAGDYELAGHHLQEAKRHEWLPAGIDLERLLLTVQSRGPDPDNERLAHRYLRAGHPQEVLLLEALVKGYIHSYRFNDAQVWLNFWVQRHPRDYQPRYWRGVVFNYLQLYEQAGADYEQALALRPGHAETRDRLSLLMMKRATDIEGTLRHFEEAIQQFPDHPGVQLGLAAFQRKLNQIDAARASLDKLLNNDKAQATHRVGGLIELAIIESDAENYPRALALLQEADRLIPKEQTVLHQMAKVLRLLRRAPEADDIDHAADRLDQLMKELEDTTTAIQKDSRNAELRYKMGTIFIELGQELEAARWFANALQQDANHRGANKALADYLEKQPDKESRERARFYRRRAEGRVGQ